MAAEVLALLGKAGKKLAKWHLQQLMPLQVMKETGLANLVSEKQPSVSHTRETRLVKIAGHRCNVLV